MDGSGTGGGKVFGRFTEPAHQVLDLAREEAERAGHRYLGPEHVLLGLLAEDHSRAAQLLRTAGVELGAARAALARLVDRGLVSAPRRCLPKRAFAQPLPTNGILVAITVMKRTFASKGRLAIWRTALPTWSTSISGSGRIEPSA